METTQTGAVNGQYLKYSDSFKKQCVLNILAGVCILIGAILMFIAAYIVCWAIKKYMFGQVKTAILKEDYNIK